MSLVSPRRAWRLAWICLPLSLATLALSYVAASASARESALANESSLAAGSGRVAPLARAHAHNDYQHRRPLVDALARGFSSIEADVWLLRGELLVAHNFWNVSPERTLESLYLAPLERRVARNRGRVYPDSTAGIQLLIDVKTDAEATYRALQRQLARHAALLTRFERGHVRRGAVTAIISGNCPRELMAAEPVRYAACDGRLEDLGGASRANLLPLISGRWGAIFDWEGEGPMPRDQRARLHSLAHITHSRGQQLRFWSTPDSGKARAAVWSELLAAGVDFINTDALDALRSFLLRHDSLQLPISS